MVYCLWCLATGTLGSGDKSPFYRDCLVLPTFALALFRVTRLFFLMIVPLGRLSFVLGRSSSHSTSTILIWRLPSVLALGFLCYEGFT